LVARAFLAVNAMVERPRHLVHPRIVRRVLLDGRPPAQQPDAVNEAVR
jgi:hypothetical protein